MKRRLGISMLLALWAAASPGATFVVTKETDDNGPCTPDDCALREAVLAANALPGADVIEIPGGTYQLSLVGPVEENFSQTGDLDALEDVEIRGDPFNPVTIIGDGTDRVLHMIGMGTAVYEVSHVTITGGAAVSSGGGLRASGLSFTLRDSTITGNTTQFGDGGGLFAAAVRSATVRNCTIVGNSAPNGHGGGIFASSSFAFDRTDLMNVTVSGNSAFSGGGMYVSGFGRFDLVNLTIADNVANVVFGDGFVGDTIGFNGLTFSNTLIANNNCGFISAIPASNGHNMEGPTAGCFNPIDGDQMGVPNVKLGPLADHGGPTQTHALLPGSPAIDAALDADCPDVDQRGLARPADGDGDFVARCDVGAFEANAAPRAEIPALSPAGLLTLLALLAGAGLFYLRGLPK